jgi:hypothetical protein
MATIFRNSIIKDVGQTPIEAFEVGQNKKNIVLGISLTNTTDSTVLGSVLISDEGSVTAYYVKDVAIPPNTTLRAMNGGEKLILDQYHRLAVQASWADSLDAIISFVEQV